MYTAYRCICWESNQRPPIATVLGVLLELLPSTPVHSQLLQQQPDFNQSDRLEVTILPHIYAYMYIRNSLGVVFLSVADSTDVGVELQALSVSDTYLAKQLESEAKESQIIRDSQLAEQLQMKENSYLYPRYCG